MFVIAFRACLEGLAAGVIEGHPDALDIAVPGLFEGQKIQGRKPAHDGSYCVFTKAYGIRDVCEANDFGFDGKQVGKDVALVVVESVGRGVPGDFLRFSEGSVV
ncbi:hypothetical protein [Desulfolutivibrio sulfoxidireducens]|uniref:hypothetical protein n=1 Tax=Desulfolutivibrio sulfoxidireducens TaxID=2773299 RepID=UPI00159DF2AD|nr:hypothetical protein [Desulfolutivibrio sulfoxidireducens]QLA18181.1 hypothetical protein GD605_18625 [Desulfolutivibrio sulfoxidireducens]